MKTFKGWLSAKKSEVEVNKVVRDDSDIGVVSDIKTVPSEVAEDSRAY